MGFINISVKKHKITPNDVAARNDPSESKAPVFNEGRHSFEWREVGHVGVGGDMRKATYDRTNTNVVDNADTLNGSTLTQVRDHAPKGHNNDVHLHSLLSTCNKYSKEYMDLLGIDVASLEDYDLAGVRTHVPLTHGNDYHNKTFLTTCDKYTKGLMDVLGVDAATLGGKTLGVGADNIAFYDADGRVADVTKVKGTTVGATDIGAGKLLAYDAATEAIVYKTLPELVPPFTTDGKLILTGSNQIGTKTGNLGELWDKSTKLVTGDFEATEFNQQNKIPLLDASTFLTLGQVVGNVDGLSATGKLILTQAGTKVPDLGALWNKTTKLVTSDFDDATFNVASGMVKLDATVKVPYTLVPEVGGAATFVVAASNSENKDKADYVCTGTDDQGKVMEAIADLPASGGSIILLDGTYTVDADNDPVKVDTQNNVTIQGQGKGTKLCLDTGISSNIIEVANASGITIKDLYVDGTTTAGSAGDDTKQCGVIFITVTDSKIRNVLSMSNKRHGINLTTTSQRSTVTGCICKDNVECGVYIYSSAYNILWKNIVTDNTVDGIKSYLDSDNNTIVGNRLNGNGGFGIFVAASNNNILTGNTSNGNANDSIQILNSDYNTVTGNSCCNGGDAGVRLDDDAKYNTLFGNTLSGNVMGIYIPYGDLNTIAGNTCNNNTPFDGIYATSECLTISGNTCLNNADNGLAVLVYGGNVLFGNSCYNNSSNGLLVYQNLDYNTLVGNTSNGNTEHGLYLYDTNYNTITSNAFHANLSVGLILYASSNNSVSNNTSMSNSQKVGSGLEDIRIWSNSDYNNIQRNTCRAGGGPITPGYGLSIASSDCTANVMTNNDVYNDNYGLGSINIAVGSGTVTTPGNRTA